LRERIVRRRLHAVLKHSLESVPAIQLKYAQAEAARTPGLAQFAPTTRTELRNLPTLAHLSTSVQGAAMSDASSGSSGTRFVVVRDGLDSAIGDAIWMRTYAQLGWHPAMRRARLRYPDPMTDHQPMRDLRARLGLPQPAEISTALPLDIQVNALLRYCPDLIHGSPYEIARVCDELERCKLRLSPTVVVCAGEPLHRDVAQRIGDRLGVAPRSVYGTTEAGLVAWTCRDGRYHVNSDVVVVELLSDGRDGRGNVLLTTLLRRAMPLIRFAPHDVILPPSKGPCVCRSRWPPLGDLLGPERSFLELPGGRRIPERDVAAALAPHGGSHHFVLNQRAADSVDVWVRAELAACRRARRALGHALHVLTAGALRFALRPTDLLPRGRTGKYALVRRALRGTT
jgi:phenylacetate-CoA ligase